MRSLGDRINVLRGIAILGVIAVHTSAHFPQAKGLPPVVFASIGVDVFSHYAVPLFVLLSGITLSLRYGRDKRRLHVKSFYRRRLLKIVPPYIAFSLLYLLLFTVEYGAPPVSGMLVALATGSAYYHLWFVVLLLQLYLLFPLLQARLARAGRRGTGPVILVALLLQLGWNTAAPVVASALPARPLVDTLLSERFFLSHVFYFVLGMVAGRDLAGFDRRIRTLPTAPILVTVAGLVALTSLEWIAAIRRHGSFGTIPPGEFVAGLAAEPLLFLATIVLAWQLTVRLQHAFPSWRNALAWLGILSLPVYLVHVLFQRLLARVLEPAGLTPDGWGFYVVMFVATLALSLGAAVLFMYLPHGELLTGAPARRGERPLAPRPQGNE